MRTTIHFVKYVANLRHFLINEVNLPGVSEGKLFNFISRACPPRFVQGRFQGKDENNQNQLYPPIDEADDCIYR